MTAEVNQHHPTPPPAPTSCRNPNKKTNQRFSSRQSLHFKKALGYHLYLSENIKPSTFSSQVFFKRCRWPPRPGEPRSRMRMAGSGGSPRCPRCPGKCPGPDTSLCASPTMFQWRGEPRWWGRVSRSEGSGMGQGGGGRPGGRERPLETLPQSIRGAEGPCAPAEGGGLVDIRRDEGYGSKRG